MWFGSKDSPMKVNRPTTLNVKPITTIESISESLGTLGSGSIGRDEDISDTDHTDLNSDYDEEELRKELMKDVS